MFYHHHHPFLFVLFKLCIQLKLARYLTWPHHRLTTLLYFYMRACKCQLFTDEGSHRLPKHLNYQSSNPSSFHESTLFCLSPLLLLAQWARSRSAIFSRSREACFWHASLLWCSLNSVPLTAILRLEIQMPLFSPSQVRIAISTYALHHGFVYFLCKTKIAVSCFVNFCLTLLSCSYLCKSISLGHSTVNAALKFGRDSAKGAWGDQHLIFIICSYNTVHV